MKTVRILGIPIHRVTRNEVLATLSEYIESGRPHQVTTVNPEFVVEAQHNKQFHAILNQADLSLADGTGITWAARFLGSPLPQRIPGADLIADLVSLAVKKQWRLYLLGGGSGIAQKAKERLTSMYPGITIVGAEEGIEFYPAQDRSKQLDELIERIKQTKPDILLVAFGAPKQEMFIGGHKKELAIPVMIGVGGTLDFLAGRVKRAPRFFRSLGLEWLWRLLKEPRRFQRIVNAIFIFPFKVVATKPPRA